MWTAVAGTGLGSAGVTVGSHSGRLGSGDSHIPPNTFTGTASHWTWRGEGLVDTDRIRGPEAVAHTFTHVTHITED